MTLKITPDLIKAQVDLEEAAKAQARLKSLERSERAIKSKKGSQSNSGVRIIAKTIPDLVKLMANDLMQGTQNQNWTEAQFYTYMLEPGVLDCVRLEDMANIGLSYMLDAVGSGDKFVPLTSLHVNIGSAIEDQARFVTAQQANPKFVEYLADRYFNAVMASSKKAELARLELDAHDDPRLTWEPWGIERITQIGSWVAWLVSVQLPWFQIVKLKANDEKFPTRYLILSEEGRKERENIELAAAKRAYARIPMLIPPNPWVECVNNVNGKVSYEGGYLTETSYGHGHTGRVIHGPKALVKSRPSETAIKYLNRVQAQPWRINTWILDILEGLTSENIEIGAFVSYVKDSFHIPEIPDGVMQLDDEDPVKQKARKELWAALELQRKRKNRRIHPIQTITLAREWADKDRFWIPWFFDTRLRAYPLVSKLSPQGTDFHKALLLFADGARVTDENRAATEEVLLIAIATTWGQKVDKKSFNDRIAFARQHIADHCSTILADPLSSKAREIWTTADEPFQHLALIKEYSDIFIQGTSDVTRVPVGFDATCSGLQLLGSFVRDKVTCELVNVLPGEHGRDSAPRDAYGAVAQKAQAILSDPMRWKQIKGLEDQDDHGIPIEKIERSVAKKVVMLIPYGGAYDTLVDHVRDATSSWGLSLMQGHWLTKALILGMSDAVPGFASLNTWFRSAAKQAMDQGKPVITWRTAAGSEITQHYRDPMVKQVQTFLTNKARFSTQDRTSRRHKTDVVEEVIYNDWEDRVDNPNIAYGWGDVLKRKHETALAANWTHSQDAAVLQLAFAEFDRPFTTVHDCLYCPAAVIPSALDCIRSAFVSVVQWPAIDEFIRMNELTLDAPPMGDADVASALKSEYLFS